MIERGSNGASTSSSSSSSSSKNASKSGSKKRSGDGTSSYSYSVIDTSEMIHFVPSSEVEFGFQACLMKNVPVGASGSGSSSNSNNSSSSSNNSSTSKMNAMAALAAAVKSITEPVAVSPGSKNRYTYQQQQQQQQHHNYNYSTGGAGASGAQGDGSSSSSTKNEFACHNDLVNLIFDDRPSGGNTSRDVAYLRVSNPGKAFETYDREKYKLPITMAAYFDLLKFFKTEWRMVESRIEMDHKNMLEKREWMSLCPTISFRGGANICFRTQLDSSNCFTLDLVIRKHYETGKRTVSLEYSEESMGKLIVPGPVLEQLAKDKDFLLGLSKGEYKEAPVTKRSRQY
jgi:hypothetical protein